MSHSSRSRTGFTLIEVAVVLVVLAILAAIAVPTFARFIAGTREGVAEQGASSVVRDAYGLAALDGGRTSITDSDIDSILDTAGAGTNSEVSAITYDATDGIDTMGTFTVVVAGTSCTVPLRTTTEVGPADCGGGSLAVALSYPDTSFTGLSTFELLTPLIDGATPDPGSVFTVAGTLPDDVSFDPTSGTFTGPSVWNFEATKISSGTQFSCALTTLGTVRCWGRNDRGQLGDGNTVSRNLPQDVLAVGQSYGGAPLTDIVDISTGSNHACAVRSNGTVACWGDNTYGQLGDGAAYTLEGGVALSPAPVNVLDVGESVGGALLSSATSVDVGYQRSCVVLSNSEARCWGYDANAGLGGTYDGNSVASTPLVVLAPGGGTLTGVVHIAADRLSCAALADGTASCWGDNSTFGAPFTVTEVASTTVPMTNIAGVDTSSAHACFLKSSGPAGTGQVACMGTNTNGQLGDGTTTSTGKSTKYVVTSVAGGALTGATSVEVTNGSSCAVMTDTTAQCWGSNIYGQLGLGIGSSAGRIAYPTSIVANSEPAGGAALTGVASVSLGTDHGCVLQTSNAAACFGLNAYGQIALGVNDTYETVQVVQTSLGNAGFPSAVTVSVTLADGRTGTVTITLTGP